MMDGLLVGLALVTGNSAGIFMSTAMAVEMGFLGLTFAVFFFWPRLCGVLFFF
jgi:hypothetical protein